MNAFTLLWQVPAIKPRKPSENGQAMVEFALTIPLFLAILFGFVLFAMLFYSYLTVTLASREGASAIVRDPTLTVAQVQTRVQDTSISLDRNALTITIEPARTSWVSGAQVSVTASYIVPLPVISIPYLRGPATRIFGPIPVTSTSVMTIE